MTTARILAGLVAAALLIGACEIFYGAYDLGSMQCEINVR